MMLAYDVDMSIVKKTILVVAGGTGGHIMPALSVAHVLRARGWHIRWLGTRARLEASLVPAQGFTMDYIDIAGIRGKTKFTQLLAPWRIIKATLQAYCVLRRVRPQVVLGMGGFVTGPACVAAKLLRIPVVIHEQNAIAGMTNRYLAKIANTVCSGFPDTFAKKYAPIVVGNPVRETIAAIAPPEIRYQGKLDSQLHLLVLGGSLGAAAINAVLPKALSQLPVSKRPVVWHQTGNNTLNKTLAEYDRLGVKARVVPFIDDMASAYAWAHVVICRAGASTIAELAAVGLASVLVPYPYAVDDHQYDNGCFLADKGAAVLMRQSDFSVQTLLQWLHSDQCANWQAMAQAARAMRMEAADVTLAEECIHSAKKYDKT